MKSRQEIFDIVRRSLVELFEKNAREYADRPAFNNMGKTITFGQLDKLSRDFGAWLQGKGLGKGARVAIMMPNCLQYPVVLFAVLRAGYIVVNVNPLYTARELEHLGGDQLGLGDAQLARGVADPQLRFLALERAVTLGELGHGSTFQRNVG